MRTRKTLMQSVDEVLAQVNAAETVKHAEVDAIREATPVVQSQIAELLRKTAATIRTQSTDVTYDDLQQFMEGQL